MSYAVKKKMLAKNAKQNGVGKNSDGEPNIRATRGMANLAIGVAPQANAAALKSPKKHKLNDGIVSQSGIIGNNSTKDKAEGTSSDQKSQAWRAEDFLTAITKELTKKYCDIGKRLGLKRIPKCLLSVDNCSKFHHRKTVSIQQQIYSYISKYLKYEVFTFSESFQCFPANHGS